MKEQPDRTGNSVRYSVILLPFTVEADSVDEARGEALQRLVESPDLFVVTEDRDKSAELYEAEIARRKSA